MASSDAKLTAASSDGKLPLDAAGSDAKLEKTPQKIVPGANRRLQEEARDPCPRHWQVGEGGFFQILNRVFG